MGFQGAAGTRSARTALRLHAARGRAGGAALHAQGGGSRRGHPLWDRRPRDDHARPLPPERPQLWLLWLASEYVLATRDVAFLREEIPTGRVYGAPPVRAPVGELLDRAYRHVVDVTGTGKHGLARLSNGDWNDGAVLGFVPQGPGGRGPGGRGERPHAAFATYVLDLYGRMLEYAGAGEQAAWARAKAEEQRAAVRRQWTGRWFRRQWLDRRARLDRGRRPLARAPALGHHRRGGHPGAAGDPRRVDRQLVRRPSPIGAICTADPSRSWTCPPASSSTPASGLPSTARWSGRWRASTAASPGTSERRTPRLARGALPGHLVRDLERARRLQLGSLLAPGRTYVAPASGGGDHAGPTVNWTDFPVMNLHPHAWTLYGVPKLLGSRLHGRGRDDRARPPAPRLPLPFPSPGPRALAGRIRGLVRPARGGRVADRAEAGAVGSVALLPRSP